MSHTVSPHAHGFASPGCPAPTAPRPAELVRSLAGQNALWRPLVRFSDPRFSVRLASGADWDAWLLCWLPGQATGWHDHGGSTGAFAVLAGSLDESVHLDETGHLRYAAAATTRRPTRRYRAGAARSFGAAHVHDVAARGRRRAVSLHVYAPRLTEMTRYRVGPTGELVVSSRERAGEDW